MELLDDGSKATSDPASGGSNGNPVDIVGGFGSLYSLPAEIRACIFGQVCSPSEEHRRYVLSYKWKQWHVFIKYADHPYEEVARFEQDRFTITSPRAGHGLRGLRLLLHISRGMRSECRVEGWKQFRVNCWVEFADVESMDDWVRLQKRDEDVGWVRYINLVSWFGGCFLGWTPDTFKTLRSFPNLQRLSFVMREVRLAEQVCAVSAVTAMCPGLQVTFDILL